MNRFTGFARTRRQITAKFLQSALVYMCHIQNISIHAERNEHMCLPTPMLHDHTHGNIFHFVEIFDMKEQTGGIVVYVLRVVL